MIGIRQGDVFQHRGLDGSEIRNLTIIGCSVSGQVQARIDLEGFSPSLVGIPLTEFYAMVEAGIVRRR